MVLATMFVSLPFVVREVVPVLREIGTDQEQAAATLGAGPFATFRRVTLPAIRWAVAYGVVLTTARSIGEFGAVSVVSGRISGKTETLTLLVQDRYESFDVDGRVRRVGRARDDRRRDARAADDLQAQGGARVISVRNVTKRFGEFVALDDVSVDVDERRAARAARAERLRASRRCCASSPGSSGRTPARCSSPGARRRGCGRSSAASASSSSTTRRSST